MHIKGAIMNCEEIGNLITAFHHGELSDTKDKLVEKHIAEPVTNLFGGYHARICSKGRSENCAEQY